MDYVPNFSYLCIIKEMNMIERKLSKIIQAQLFKGKAIILVGSRQVGKTTLLGELVRQSDKRILSLNCDEPEVQTILTDTNVAKLRTIIGNNELVVIDEAQKVNNIGLTLKLIVDNIKDVQVIATGSSAFELRNRLNEPLTGRKFEYQMYPISSGEFIDTFGLLEEKRTLENRLDIIGEGLRKKYLSRLTEMQIAPVGELLPLEEDLIASGLWEYRRNTSSASISSCGRREDTNSDRISSSVNSALMTYCRPLS